MYDEATAKPDKTSATVRTVLYLLVNQNPHVIGRVASRCSMQCKLVPACGSRVFAADLTSSIKQ